MVLTQMAARGHRLLRDVDEEFCLAFLAAVCTGMLISGVVVSTGHVMKQKVFVMFSPPTKLPGARHLYGAVRFLAHYQ